MVFCGQCGLQLPPGTTQCPRCGASVDADVPAGEFHADDPTVASPAYTTRNPSNPSQPGLLPPTIPPAGGSQQKLVLGRDVPGYDYGTQASYEATNRVDAQNFATRAPNSLPSTPGIGSSYPGYGSPSGGNYPSQGASYPGFAPQGGFQQQSPGQYAQAQPPSNAKGRLVGLVLILIGLLFVLSAVVLFALQSNSVIGSTGGTGTPVATTAPTQQAQALIQEYYTDVNAHNYQAAYNLWKNNQQTFADFKSGYKNTFADTVSFGTISQQTDGTVQVTVTIKATERTSTGTQQSTYQGYYTVEPQSDGTWRIIGGNINRV